jgi:hypothetical protein
MLDSGLPEKVAPAEALAKFILSSRHFSAAKKRVMSAAFIPPPGKGSSVFRISELALEDVRIIGSAVASARQPPRTLYGHALLLAQAVLEASLDVVAVEPPPRHADIIGWPNEKDAQLEIAQSLADASTPILYG